MIQNFTYTSKATGFGSGPKEAKKIQVPEWFPGPGTYEPKSDFVNKQTEKFVTITDENN